MQGKLKGENRDSSLLAALKKFKNRRNSSTNLNKEPEEKHTLKKLELNVQYPANGRPFHRRSPSLDLVNLAEEKFLEGGNSVDVSPEPSKGVPRDSTLLATSMILSNLGTHKKTSLRPKMNTD